MVVIGSDSVAVLALVVVAAAVARVVEDVVAVAAGDENSTVIDLYFFKYYFLPVSHKATDHDTDSRTFDHARKHVNCFDWRRAAGPARCVAEWQRDGTCVPLHQTRAHGAVVRNTIKVDLITWIDLHQEK